jgi:transposase-like protein
VLEALKSLRTINEIARENEVAPSQVSAWKKELEPRIDEIFEGKSVAARELARKEAREEKLE